MRRLHHKSAGFTLLEVLIAISIFAIIGLGAYRMLDMIILSQVRVDSHTETLRKTERAMQLISMDFEQLVDRPIRDNYADKLAAILSPQQDYLIEFTRQGWRNPLQFPRSQLQRVAYELGSISNSDSNNGASNESSNGTHLLRHYWNVLDRAQDSQPRTQVLLKNVDDLQVRFLGSEGQWHTEWPPTLATGKKPHGLPSAVVLEIQTQSLGQIERLFQLSEMGEWQAASTQEQVTFAIDEETSEPKSVYDDDDDYDDDDYDYEDAYEDDYEDDDDTLGAYTNE
jgi:general secretion pathway protein J